VKKYRVTVSYRPHVSSLRREEVSFTIEARNKQAAIFRAGWYMHRDGHHHIADSINILGVEAAR
jgi:hypothetical protein